LVNEESMASVLVGLVCHRNHGWYVCAWQFHAPVASE
jgi:hypothetical protein